MSSIDTDLLFGAAEPDFESAPPLPVNLSDNIDASVDFSEVQLDSELTEQSLAEAPSGVLALDPTPIEGRLRHVALSVPEEIEECSGFTLFGRRIRSLLYTTDVAVIKNSNADAIFAVYPFTGQPAITQALLTVAEAPVFVGVGGGKTNGKRSVQLAAISEMQGAAGVIVNSPAKPDMVDQIANFVDIPVVATVLKCDALAHAKIAAGAKIINVAAGKDTPKVLRELRAHYPNMPLIATSGKSAESIRETIAAGANAIIWTPPSAQQLQTDMMKRYRAAEEAPGPDPTEAIFDPVSAADVNPLENTPADIPIPDELIARGHSVHESTHTRQSPLGFFFSRRRRNHR
ncbi:hypothetical protein [Collinsella sp. zg1085]|uniref:hypothetical protein n=1 Tax=Collinsella sp. zg1085 TaxID=2844380 RepID=UPI00209B15D6|nr:hypothetical protein [Collinsella sp. zg1085]